MKIILLSGGSGSRLWPLSNETRSKQFLRILDAPDGSRESMVQRIVRQIKSSALADADITFATSLAQRDIITNQLGQDINVVTEPCRRDTFPAIALAATHLATEQAVDPNEVVIVMPCDTFTDIDYFNTIHLMAQAVESNVAPLVLMGINPTYPTTKYGYVVPAPGSDSERIKPVARFTEKPDMAEAEALLAQNAFWNGGVFAFRLSYMTSLVAQALPAASAPISFDELRAAYSQLPAISFDYEVAENATSMAMVTYYGRWKDLGTWLTLTDELNHRPVGNVILDSSLNTHVINELELPIMCIGANNMVIAASADGILISDKSKSENIAAYAHRLSRRPMYEERRWGEYKVIDNIEFPDGHKALTKQLIIRAGKNISYQVHHHRDEVWTFIDGEGLLVLDGEVQHVGRGDVINIKKGVRHAVKALTDLHFIEVQSGDQLIEEDIDRFPYTWPD
jgi:mannose-1-phosphate guanylyltransferase